MHWLGAGFESITTHNVAHPYLLDTAEAYETRAFSALHLISDEALQRGLDRMQDDLREDQIPCASQYALLWGTMLAD